MNKLTDFAKGIIAGILFSAIIFSTFSFIRYLNKRDKELIEYAQKQIEIEELREDYINRDTVDFLEIHGVSTAADGAASGFIRKRDEAIQRLRNRTSD